MMEDHAARVQALVDDPDYSPITLKGDGQAVPGPRGRVPRVPERREGDGQGRPARRRQGQGPPEGRAVRDDHRDLPPEFQGVRLRPALGRLEQGRPGLHPGRRRPRRLHRRRGPGQGRQEVPGARIQPRGAGGPGRLAGLRVVRRPLLREGRGGLRQGRRDHLRRPGLCRRPRRQGGPSRRQGRAGDGPLSHPLPRRGGGHHRGLRPPGRAQGRDDRDHPGPGDPGRLRRRHPRRGPTPGQGVRRGGRRGAARPPRPAHPHHRPGHRPRLRRRDHPDPRREGVLVAGGPHRRRLPLRPPRLLAGRHRPEAGDQRLPARTG